MRCPHCAKDMISVGKFMVCPEHGQQLLEDEAPKNKFILFSNIQSSENAEFCNKLASITNWPQNVLRLWPGPIAHELFRLKTLLEEGHFLGAVWQVKDVAEVLIKFPGVIMARDVLVNSSDMKLKSDLRSGLFRAELSIGKWLEIVRDALSNKVLNFRNSELFFPEFSYLFRNHHGVIHAAKNLDKLVYWRNNTFGHGAFRLDMNSYRDDLSNNVRMLIEIFDQWQDLKVWDGITLRVGGNSTEILNGYDTVHSWRHGKNSNSSATMISEINICNISNCLNMFPLMQIKLCDICNKYDIFFFDTRISKSKREYFYFLDYIEGHKIIRPGYLERELSKNINFQHEIDQDKITGCINNNSEDRTTNDILLESTFSSDYCRPSFIYDSLHIFLRSHDRGVFWLRGPGHCGKTTFVSKIDLSSNNCNDEISKLNIKVAVFHVKREFRYRTSLILLSLREDILSKKCLDLPADAPFICIESEDKKQAMIDWLGQLLERRPFDRLLICLDGIDELLASKESSILEYLPNPSDLPQRCYILLTSRMPSECSEILCSYINRFDNDLSYAKILNYTVTYQDYVSLLREYYHKKMNNFIREMVSKEFERLLKESSTLNIDIDDSSFCSRVAKNELNILNSKNIVIKSSVKGKSIQCEIVRPVSEIINNAFNEILNHSKGIFLYFSHITRLLSENKFNLNMLDDLPDVNQLFMQYLAEIKDCFPPKIWQISKRILIVLAIFEESFNENQVNRSVNFGNEQWQGVDLGLLAEYLNLTPNSVELIFTIYNLKDVLSVWRGDNDNLACFSIGLKNFSGLIQKTWKDDINYIRKQIINESLRDVGFNSDEFDYHSKIIKHRMFFLQSHLEIVNDLELKKIFYSNDKILDIYDYYADNDKIKNYSTLNWLFQIESFLTNSKKNPSLKTRLVNNYKLIAKEFYKLGLYELSIEYYKKGLLFGQKFKVSKELIVYLLLGLSDSAEYMGDTKNAIKSINKAINILNSANSDCNHALKLVVDWHRASLEYGSDNVEPALNILYSIVKLFDSVDISTIDKDFCCETYNFIANILAGLSRYEEAASFYEQALNSLKEDFSHDLRTTVILNMASMYHDMHKFSEAICLTRNACKHAVLSDNPDAIQYAKGVSGMILVSMGQHEDALNELNEASQKANQYNVKWRLFNIYADIAQAYLGLKNIELAYISALRSLEEAQLIGSLSFDMAYVYNVLGLVSVANGQYIEAKKYYKNAYELCLKIDDYQKAFQVLCNLAKALIECGEFQEAKLLLDEFVANYKDLLLEYDLNVADSILNKFNH